MMTKTFYLCSAACMRTRTNSQRIHNYLEANGYTFTEDATGADLIIVDTCAYTQSAEENALGIIKKYIDCRKKGAQVMVVGCLPAINGPRLAGLEQVHAIPVRELNRLDEIIHATVPLQSIPQPVNYRVLSHDVDNPAWIPNVLRGHNVRVSEGCLGRCAYCATKFATGNLKSRPIDRIVEDFKKGLPANSSESTTLMLECEDLGCYGADIKSNVVDLLTTLFAIPGNYKLKLHDFNSFWFVRFYPALSALFEANLEKIEYLFVTVESGSDRILKLMRRPYAIAEVRNAMLDLKKRMPNLLLRCSMMVGFPGETEEDFQQSFRFLEEISVLPKTEIWVTGYTDRPHTEAESMTDKVPATVIEARRSQLLRLIKNASPAPR